MNKVNRPVRAIAHTDRQGSSISFAYGFGAYALWGVLPIYFKLLQRIPAVDIVAHRVLWSLPFLALLIALSNGWSKVRSAFNSRKTLGVLALTALLIGGNWLLYVYAVTSGHILAASFGYYLNPLANVLLGRFVLQERLSRLQWTAVAIAAVGISVLAAGAVGQLWISLTLCVTFALYGLLRKVVMHYLKAVAALKSTADGKAVVAKMKEMPTDDPLFGKGTIRADGRKLHPAYLFEVKKPSESKHFGDFYKVRATIPADEAFRPLKDGGCPLVSG